MKKPVPKAKAEPTLNDVIEIMQGGFQRIEKKLTDRDEQFSRMEDTFSEIEEKITVVDKKIDHRFELMNERVNNVDARLGVIERKLVKIDTRVADIQDEMATTGAAVDADSVKIVVHEHRITELENTRT
jgi:peptidoglycan hydrolase CwlO-like protein